jgi:dTDP-4-amino-4,6-dideoxygalactose transaminase
VVPGGLPPYTSWSAIPIAAGRPDLPSDPVEDAVMSETRLRDFLPFHRPYMGDEEIAEVIDTLKSGWLTMGPKTQKFEQKFAAAVGAEHAVAVSSCTAALHLALASLGVGPGDEVITSPYTFSATAATILYVGATPVLVDTLPDYPNVDPEAVRAAVTPRTKAIMPVHFAGAPCDLDGLAAVASKCGAAIVEDAAHALPAAYKGRRIGSLGGARHAAAFSLYAGKNITTGEGGVIATNDGGLVDSLRRKRLHGISRDAWKRYSAEGTWYYQVEELGFKYNMTDINAAIGLHQLDRLEDFHRKRLALVALYDELLGEVPGILRPRPPVEGDCSWHLYVIGIDPARVKLGRNEVIDALRADNIGTSVHFIPIHHHSFYQQRLGCKKEEFPNATRLYERSISLPLFPTMLADEVKAVARSLKRILTGALR